MCWSNKAVAPHPTISAVPLPDATLARLIRPTSSRTSLPPEVLILMGYKCKKSLIAEQAFRIWSVIEDYSPLRGSPCGPLLKQRSLATLESNLCPRRFSSSSGHGRKKARSKSGLFNLVGDRGFEPPTPSSRTKCATRLRQSPNAGRILLRRYALVNPLIAKCLLIGEKVSRPLS